MKKFYLMLAAAIVFTLAGCSKPQYIIPTDDDEQETPTTDSEKEKTWEVSITGSEFAEYAIGSVLFPGEEICDFFDLTEEEFFAGMGSSTFASLTSAQSNNTIMFGLCEKNNTSDFKWVPSTTNNFGHWLTADGGLTTWGGENGEAVIYAENECGSWGADSPSAEDLESMWSFTLGVYPGRVQAGKSYSGTVVYYYPNPDDEIDYYAFVKFTIKIEAPEDVKINVVKTQEINLESPYYTGYEATPLDIDLDAVAAAIGCSDAEADVYAINSDGSIHPVKGTNFWFSIAGDVMKWGAGCGIDINKDSGSWAFCNYPDPSVCGQANKGKIAFVNPSTMNAYVVDVTVMIEAFDALKISETISYEAGENEITLNDEQIAAIAEALGLETVTADQIGNDIAIVGINADGSEYDGGYTANNGYWYGMDGNVTNWAGIEAAGYLGSYIEYRGGFVFGLGIWGDPGATNTVKLALKKDDRTAMFTFNLTVAEPALFDTEEVGTMSGEATMKMSDGYGGPTIALDYDAICSTLGLTDENFVENFKITATDGSVEYTAEAPGGYWFNTDNAICSWGDVNSAYYMNFKYGPDLPEGAESNLVLIVGVRNDDSKNDAGEATHICPPAGTYSGVVRLANIATLKHITYTFNLTVTE